MDNTIMVSVLTLAYNHANYIRQCLDGILMQQTNFRYELLIHDDASTDGTQDIIREYEARYPDIIKPIYQQENQYSKKVPIGTTFLYPRAQGKYIAFCEGDDYWTDPLKLQKQVDFLEANPEYTVCTHSYKLYYQATDTWGDTLPNVISDLEYDLDFYISYTQWVTQPLTAMFRYSALDMDLYRRTKNAKDASLFFYLLKQGKGLLMNDVMGVYRIQKNGVWSGASNSQRVAADLKTLKGICDSEQSQYAVYFLRNYLDRVGYLGYLFLIKYTKLYFQVLGVVNKSLGIWVSIKLACKGCNYFKRWQSHH